MSVHPRRTRRTLALALVATTVLAGGEPNRLGHPGRRRGAGRRPARRGRGGPVRHRLLGRDAREAARASLAAQADVLALALRDEPVDSWPGLTADRTPASAAEGGAAFVVRLPGSPATGPGPAGPPLITRLPGSPATGPGPDRPAQASG